MKFLLTGLFLFLFVSLSIRAQEKSPWQAKVTVAPELRKSMNKGGRMLFRFSSQYHKESHISGSLTAGYTTPDWDGTSVFTLDASDKGILSSGTFPATGKVYCQVVYKNNMDDAQENAPGNWYSDIDSLMPDSKRSFNLTLCKVVPPAVIPEHKFVKIIDIQSKCLSDFSGHPRFLKASILLPSGYFDHPGKSYPICYRAPGLNGRYTFVENKLKDKEFIDWWLSGEAPQVIYVFLDSRGPYGDTYQVDSENNGP